MPKRSVAQDQSEGCLSEHWMAGQTRGKFANNEPWPQLHWNNSKTLSCTCPIKSLKNSWRRVNRHGTDRLKPTPKPVSGTSDPTAGKAISYQIANRDTGMVIKSPIMKILSD